MELPTASDNRLTGGLKICSKMNGCFHNCYSALTCRAGWLRYQLPYELEQRLMFRSLIAFCEKFPNLNLG
jgi:hypothetical protein